MDHESLLKARPRVYASKASKATSLLQSKYLTDGSLARQRLFERHSQQAKSEQNRLKTALDETIGVLRSDRESHTSSRMTSVLSTDDEHARQLRLKAYGQSLDRDDWRYEQTMPRAPKLPAWLRTKEQSSLNLLEIIEQLPRMPAHQKIVNEHDRIEKELAQRRQADQFIPFTEGDEDRIEEALSEGYGQVVEGFNVTILKKDIHTLRPGEWLNDEVINFYGNLILARSKESNTLPKIHVFSTFFYKTLSEQGYDKVRRWTKKIKIFELDYVLIPIHCSGNHWTTAVIDMKKRRIEYYDSLLGNNPKCFLILRSYLEHECQDKLKKPFDFQGWENDCPKDIPRQKNGFDCGVFTCTFLECKSRGLDQFDFSQQNMPYLRKRIVLNIINKSL
ncbi:SUMO1 sentrin specific peptidase 1 [Mortierella sp. GBA30]|nr:SUMO1 sentrin specific peptidase 1 [Mortierella sp. GBA30]